MPLRPVASSQPDLVLDCHHHSNMVYDDDQDDPTMPVETSDYQLIDLNDSQTIEVRNSMDQLSTGWVYPSGSRSPSLRSHGIAVCQSLNPSMRGSHIAVNSAQSTPKLRLPRVCAFHQANAFNGSRGSMPVKCSPTKETLKRTASHTPDATRPTMCSLLRRTKSASGSLDDLRQSVDLSISSDQTSCESLSLEGCNKTKKHYLRVPVDNLGEYVHTNSYSISHCFLTCIFVQRAIHVRIAYAKN